MNQWISTDELPELKNGKVYPVLVVNIEHGKRRINKAWYFPEKFKTVEWEDWDDYSQESYPHTIDDTENQCVWLKSGFYMEVENTDGNEYWSFPLNVTHWQDLPALPEPPEK